MRVIFGAGSVASVRAEIRAIGGHRPLIVATPGRAETARAIAAAVDAVEVYPKAVGHVPAELGVAAAARARELAADSCVAVGGGAAIGLAKIIARDTGQPIVAVPTTYSGSELTPVWGETRDGRKHTAVDERVLPRGVVYDSDLTRTLPATVAATSAMNAVAHAVEALYAPDVSPLIALTAAEGIRVLTRALPDVVRGTGPQRPLDEAQYGAWLCGSCLGGTTMGLHHKLAHVLGGSFNLPHAATHAVLLPYTLGYNAEAAPEAAGAVASALDALDAPSALWALNRRIGVPASLGDLGLAAGDIDAAAELAVSTTYPNPREVEIVGVRDILRAAHSGGRPR